MNLDFEVSFYWAGIASFILSQVWLVLSYRMLKRSVRLNLESISLLNEAQEAEKRLDEILDGLEIDRYSVFPGEEEDFH